ncbi:MAG: hypothetical protein CR972_00980 [Candidatus Moraniibacteriota bacterium]|nr:MAG: hypothetical protein CR972_00980 [Candidatus Moranbacteria bacterium]
MKIAIISDIHDQIDRLEWVLSELSQREYEHTFLLGDYCSPFVISKLCAINTPINAVWGNNDGDKQTILEIAANHKQPFLFSSTDFNDVILNNKKYFITHYPSLAENAALSGKYDAVFHGHLHARKEEMINDTPIINPGKLALYPNNEKSFAIYDTETTKVEFVID